jgi:hypothetical protein
MQAILDIALGKPRTVTVGGEEQHIIVYPRDRLKAVALLQEIAREGVLPETEISIKDMLRPETTSEANEKRDMDWLIGVGVPTDFKSVTATTPDGREIKATVA